MNLKYEGPMSVTSALWGVQGPCDACEFKAPDARCTMCPLRWYYVEPECGSPAPRQVGLSTDSDERKQQPIATGVLDYFPDALAEVARLSKIGNDKHNPGEPLHWSRGKSDDHADCILRHMIDRGTVDADGVLHDAKVAWRALAMLQLAIERQRTTPA